jgi:hypothetical protein
VWIILVVDVENVRSKNGLAESGRIGSSEGGTQSVQELTNRDEGLRGLDEARTPGGRKSGRGVACALCDIITKPGVCVRAEH